MEEEKDKKDIKNEYISKNPLKWEENLFKTSPQDLFIYRKAEKICSAIHFVTTFQDEREPIRSTLRERSIDLLSLSLSFIKSANLQASISLMSARLVELKSLLQTSYHSGLISQMNFNIIKDELDHLMLTIETKRQKLFSLPTTFMEVEAPEKTEEFKGQSIGHKPGDPLNRRISGTSSINYHQGKKENIANNINHLMSDRANKIMLLLKDNNSLTIKDFSNYIKGCSEKTLQRELLKMVAEGKIKKRGERRWSRYSIE